VSRGAQRVHGALRAVRHCLAAGALVLVGIDEKSIHKCHKYFTIVSDLQSQKVLWIGRGRKRETTDAFWKTLTKEQLAGIEGISMDMWAPFFDSAAANVPDGKSKIVFDKCHIAKYLGEALDQTRKRMSADASIDRTALKGRRWLLLRNPRNMTHSQKLASHTLREEYTDLARGWSMVQAFKELWDFTSETCAQTFQAVVLLGDPLAPQVLHQACEDAQVSSREHLDLLAYSHHQCSR
jgi:transposase